jgi:small subunit ribosomal protein S5
MTEVKDTKENMTQAEVKNNVAADQAGAANNNANDHNNRRSVDAGRRNNLPKNKRPDRRPAPTEFDQGIIDLARVTRVMAGGKRMRFRACVVIGNKKGKVGIGLAKGADVTLAVNKAVNQAKKQMIDIQIVNGTIAHSIKHKFGAAEVLLRPAKKGRGIICGGVVRIIMEMAGVHNITSKIMGTNNKVSNAKCVIGALSSLQKVKVREPKTDKQNGAKQATKQHDIKGVKSEKTENNSVVEQK